MRAPRLREKHHQITNLLVRLSGNPWSIVIVVLLSVLFWETRGIDRLLALGGTLIGMLDILSNMYQEVSADDRQAELQKSLDEKAHHNQKLMEDTLERLERIEKSINNHNVTIL